MFRYILFIALSLFSSRAYAETDEGREWLNLPENKAKNTFFLTDKKGPKFVPPNWKKVPETDIYEIEISKKESLSFYLEKEILEVNA